MITTITTPAASLNGRTHALGEIVQRLDQAATSSAWRTVIAGAIAQLQDLLAQGGAQPTAPAKTNWESRVKLPAGANFGPGEQF